MLISALYLGLSTITSYIRLKKNELKMPFRERVKRAMSRRHNLKISSSPSTTNIQSEETSRNLTPFYGSGTGTPILRKNLTIDPRENPLTRIESSVTLKKRSTLSRMKSSLKKEDPYKDWPEDIYKPHEMPKAKYRRPTDPDHQQSLQSYCLRSAFEDVRRRSGVSQYSPMGSRWHSRRGSVSSRFAKSAGPSRNHSIAQALTETDDDDHDVESNSELLLPTSSKHPLMNTYSQPVYVAILQYQSTQEAAEILFQISCNHPPSTRMTQIRL